MRISVVIPAHNEEANIENIVKLLLKNFNKEMLEIIIVNDNSTDRTASILENLSKKNNKIVPVHRKKDKGVGNAIRAGLKKVSSQSTHVLLSDCDFIENMENIRTMVKNANSADGILGSRYIKKNSLKNYPSLKKVANRSFHYLAHILLGISQKDISNNLKLYKTEIIMKIIPLLKSSGFSINAETGLYPILLGYDLKEVPAVWIGRTADMGKTNFNVIKAGPGYVKVFFSALKFKYLPHSAINSAVAHSETGHFNDLIEKTGETYYGNQRPVAKIRFSRKAETILKLLDSKKIKNGKILDLGCGTGILSEYILKKQPSLHIYGIDISNRAIDVANKKLKKYKNVQFQTGDVTKLPFKDNYFDMAMCNSILHHVPLNETLAEIKRVLKPNGVLWFCEPNLLNPQIALEKNIPVVKSFFQDSPDERAFSRWNIKKELEKRNFTDVLVKPYEFLHPLLPRKFLKITSAFCIFLEKIPIISEFAGTMQGIAINRKSS